MWWSLWFIFWQISRRKKWLFISFLAKARDVWGAEVNVWRCSSYAGGDFGSWLAHVRYSLSFIDWHTKDFLNCQLKNCYSWEYIFMPIITMKILRNPLFHGAYSNWPTGVTDALYKNMDAALGKYGKVLLLSDWLASTSASKDPHSLADYPAMSFFFAC